MRTFREFEFPVSPVILQALMLGGALLLGSRPGLAQDADATDVERVRGELEAVKAEYEQRLQELEARLNEMERQAEIQAPPAPATSGASAVSDKAFNPAVSFTLNATYANYSNGDGTGFVPGFQAGGEAEGIPDGFSLSESELNLQASIDDKFYGNATLALEQDGDETEVGLEEAYIQTMTLPAGLTLRAGKFFSDIGYLNSFHEHASEFSDEPLPYRIFLGSRYKDTGVRFSWIAPSILYVNVGGELFAGDAFPGADSSNNVGTWTAFAKFGGDLGVSHSWLAGISYLSADAVERPTHDELTINPLFTGDSDLWIASMVWKWAPQGNTRERHLKLQAEYLSRQESGTLDIGGLSGTYDADHHGYYVQGAYQFRPQWAFGLRYDRLDSDNRIGGLPLLTPLDDDSFSPKRWSAMLQFSNSEFSTLRFQYSRDRSLPQSDNLFIVEYVMSIGAHGAHAF